MRIGIHRGWDHQLIICHVADHSWRSSSGVAPPAQLIRVLSHLRSPDPSSMATEPRSKRSVAHADRVSDGVNGQQPAEQGRRQRATGRFLLASSGEGALMSFRHPWPTRDYALPNRTPDPKHFAGTASAVCVEGSGKVQWPSVRIVGHWDVHLRHGRCSHRAQSPPRPVDRGGTRGKRHHHHRSRNPGCTNRRSRLDSGHRPLDRAGRDQSACPIDPAGRG